MELTDTHTHTWYSGHGSGTVLELVQAACEKGLTTLAVTEHLPLPAALDPSGAFGMTEEQVPRYLADVEQARTLSPELEIICGAEVDWRTGAESYILERIKPYKLVMGSVHMFTKGTGGFWAFDHPSYIDGWEMRGEEQVWQEYFELWSAAVLSKVPFTVMAHPDIPKKLGFKPRFDAREMYASMAEIAAKKDVLIEVNTSGVRKVLGELYPAPALLKAFCAAGVGCTVGSDAHTPSDVGRDLDKAYAAMQAAGYRHVTVPTGTGDRRQIALDI